MRTQCAEQRMRYSNVVRQSAHFVSRLLFQNTDESPQQNKIELGYGMDRDYSSVCTRQRLAIQNDTRISITNYVIFFQR